jgi:flagellar motor switch/type III secretory pathway protein FliN
MIPVQQLEAASEADRHLPPADSEDDTTGVSHLRQIPMRAEVVLGMLPMKLRAISALKVGTVLRTRRTVGEPLDLLVNAAPVALAQVCPVKEKLGVRVVGLHKEQ